MTEIIADKVASLLKGLGATSEIPTALGTRLVASINLFVGFEVDTDVDSITLIPYPGSPPNKDGYRQESSVQIRLKTSSTEKALKVGQACVNYLHMKQVSGVARIQALNSGPLILGRIEGEEWCISTVNFSIKHIKV